MKPTSHFTRVRWWGGHSDEGYAQGVCDCRWFGPVHLTGPDHPDGFKNADADVADHARSVGNEASRIVELGRVE